MTTRYAATTEVSVAKSRAAIEDLLRTHGATEFASGWDPTHDKMQFRLHDQVVRFLLPRPDPNDRSFSLDKRGFTRTPGGRQAAFEQADRQRWRALYLVIRAKIEAVEAGIAIFEQEFLAFIRPAERADDRGHPRAAAQGRRVRAAPDRRGGGALMRPTFILAVLLIAAPASAVPIIPPMPHCGCSLVEVEQPPAVHAPDPGYSPDLTAAQIAELRRLDDLHEPAPEPELWTWVCVDLTLPWGKPGHPGEPDGPHMPMGGGGQPGGGSSVPEPSSLALIACAGVGVWLRRRG